MLAWTGCSSGSPAQPDSDGADRSVLHHRDGHGGNGGGKPGGGGGYPLPTADSAIVFGSGTGGPPALGFIDADGTNLAMIEEMPGNSECKWSPDGQKILFWASTGKRKNKVAGLYTVNIDGTGLTTLILETDRQIRRETAWSPVATPDGNFKIAYSAEDPYDDSPGFNYDIWLINDDGSNPTNLTNTLGSSELRPTFSPDGTRLAYFRHGADIDSDVWVHDLTTGETTNVTAGSPISSGTYKTFLSWARTQDKIALEARPFGPNDPWDWDIWVIDINDPQNPFDFSAALGLETWSFSPNWSPDDSEILFAYVIDGIAGYYIANADGTNRRTLFIPPDNVGLGYPDWKR